MYTKHQTWRRKHMHDILKNANQIYVNIGYNQTEAIQK